MNRRDLLKTIGFASLGVLGSNLYGRNILFGPAENEYKNWAWLGANLPGTNDELKSFFNLLKESGIDAVLLEVFDSGLAHYASGHLPNGEKVLERVLPIAKSAGIEVHAWMWTMICNIEKIINEHRDWFMVNGKGESCLDKPAYVPYYRFLCPSRSETGEFIAKRISELSQYSELDGIHLDYVRYPDVIIAEALQPQYGIVQDREYPEYDYCYCEVCRNKFKEQSGIDPLGLDRPEINLEWRQFRCDNITNLVNNVFVPIAKKNGKQITAAVFPPHNFFNVRQEWPKWNLDAFLPMLYHNYYYEDILWIKEQTQLGVELLKKSKPVYPGLMVFEFKPAGLKKAIEAAISGGGSGVVLFTANYLPDEYRESIKEIFKNL